MADRSGRPAGLLLNWGPVAIYVLLIFYVSSMSNPPGVPPIANFDKLIHFGEYGLLGLLLGRALGLARLKKRYWAIFAVSLMIGASVAGADEHYQGAVSGREKSLADFLADVLGLLAALTVLRVWAVRGKKSDLAAANGRAGSGRD